MNFIRYLNLLDDADLMIVVAFYQALLFIIIMAISYFLLKKKCKTKRQSILISLIFSVVLSGALHNSLLDRITERLLYYDPRYEFNLPFMRVRYHKLVSLCEKYSVNEIYDEKEFDRYKRISGYSPYSSENNPDYEPYRELKDVNEINKIMSPLGETYDPEEHASYGLREKNGFIAYDYYHKDVNECISGKCDITQFKIYSLKNKKLISHNKDFSWHETRNGIYYSPSCEKLRIGAFKNRTSKY